jgi:hypothetical protein
VAQFQKNIKKDSEDNLRKLHKRGGSGIRKNSSRIQGVKKHRIADPDPQHYQKKHFAK